MKRKKIVKIRGSTELISLYKDEQPRELEPE